MANGKTVEQVIREIVAEHVFQIAQLISQNDNLTKEVQRLTLEIENKKGIENDTP